MSGDWSSDVCSSDLGAGCSGLGCFPVPALRCGPGRCMLVTAAAGQWNVEPSACRAERGTVINTQTDEMLPYADLVADAAALDVPLRGDRKSVV